MSGTQKRKFIGKTSTYVEKIDSVGDWHWASILLNLNRMKANWRNVLKYFESLENEMDESLFNFLNDRVNTTQLSKFELSKVSDDISEDLLEAFETVLLKSNELSDDAYSILVSSISGEYNFLEFGHLSEGKGEALLRNRLLALTSENISLIKKSFPKLLLTFLLQRFDQVLNEIAELPLDDGDIVAILQTSVININDKIKIIERFDKKLLSNSIIIKQTIGKFLIQPDVLMPEIDVSMLMEIIIAPWNEDDRITLFASKINLFSKDSIRTFLKSLKEPYSSLCIPGNHVILEKNSKNSVLAQSLKKTSYVRFDNRGKKELQIEVLPDT
jgi:hypothetical protein